MWYLIVSIPDLCRLSFFALASHCYCSTQSVELCFSKVSNVRSISESFGKPHLSLILTNQGLNLNLSITNGIVSSKIYDKRDDFNFEIVNFPFLDGDVPRSPSYGVYISQLIRFARVCSNVDDFNNRNLFLTAKLLKQGYRYHKIRQAFSKFYHRHSELIVKYNIGLKTLLQQGISEPIFYGDLVYKFKRIVGKPNFSDQFKKIVKRYKRVGYNLDIMRQSACLVVNPITVYSYGFLFNCTTVGRASDSMTALIGGLVPDAYL